MDCRGKKTMIKFTYLQSFSVMFIYLIFSVYLTPMALNKSRQMLSQSQFNSFLPTIRSKQFSDSFKGLTFFVDRKINNEIENIFLYDVGKNLKNFSSNISDTDSTTIIAEKGIVRKKQLFLIKGQIISYKKSKNESEVLKFEQLNIDLNRLTTTVIKKLKLQETSTFILLKCFVKNNNLKICKGETKKEIIPILVRRLILPIYIPVFCLICSFLFFKNENHILQKVSIFTANLVILIFIELMLKYTGTNYFLTLFYTMILLIIAHHHFIYKFSKKLNMNNIILNYLLKNFLSVF